MIRPSYPGHSANGGRRAALTGHVPLLLLLVLALCALPIAPAGHAADARTGTARFVVGSKVINPDLQPVAATVNDLGNGVPLNRQPGGFEPRIYRTMFVATGGTADRIVAPHNQLSQFDMLRTGALDGAEIEVLRIENGAFRSVRHDRIAPGGFQLGDWVSATRNQALPADQTRFDFVWAKWNRSGVPYYFTVRAVDRQGRLSQPAAAVSAVKPETTKRQETSEPSLTEIALSDVPATDLPAPRDLSVRVTPEGIAQLSWKPVRGAAGYLVYRSDDPPEALRGSYIQLAGTGPEIRAGDLVILRDEIWQPDRARLLSNRSWGSVAGQKLFGVPQTSGWPDETGGNWQLVAHETAGAVPGGGAAYLRADLEPGQTLDLGSYNHAGVDQGFYPVLEPGRDYRFEVWLRGTAQTPVRFELQGPYSPKGKTGVPATQTRVTPDWTRFSGTFRVPAVSESSKTGRMELVLTGPGRIDVDNFRVFPDEAPYLAMEPGDRARLAASGMDTLRLQRFGITDQNTYDLAQLTNPAGATNIRGGQTLPQQLALVREAGMTPWIQIEPHLSRDEWLGLAEFLAAPFTPGQDSPAALPWAAKRAAEGQSRPWADEFDRIRFEIGNETWNRIYAPWIFPALPDAATGATYSKGAVYGLYQEYVLGILRESPWWPRIADKLEPILGGWSGQKYGLEAAATSPSSDFLTIASYNGGWDEGEGPVRPTPEGFASVLSSVLQANLPRAQSLTAAAATLPPRTPALRLGTYEAGPGYALDGLNNSKVTPEQVRNQELVMKSAAAGTATLDAILALASTGFTLQNYYAYQSGEYWASHARWNRGGQTYPAWDLVTLFNREALGDMLAVETLEAPRRDLSAAKRRVAVTAGPMVAAYATRSGNRLTLILISRRVPFYPDPQDDGRTRVSVELPISGAGRLTLWHQTGRFDSTNATAAETVLEHQDLPVPASLPRLDVATLEPGATLVFVFDDIH